MTSSSEISPLPRSLNVEPRLHWNEAQEQGISREFPFDCGVPEQSAEDYATRVYLQFLWLPESIMDLKLLVPSLRRVMYSPATSPHPLHSILDRILLTSRTVSSKYHVDLNRLLAQGGSGSEVDIEEAMMWYALSHEITDNDSTDEPWSDEAWKVKWLNRMERRELLIQILLYFLKLTLPGPEPEPAPSLTKKRKRQGYAPERPAPTIQSRLESLMDKLSTWQLVGSIEVESTSTANVKPHDDRDWMQVFCEDVLEPCFQDSTPDLCSLLRSKVFPSSPFSDTDDDGSPSVIRSSPPSLPLPAPTKRLKSPTADDPLRHTVQPTESRLPSALSLAPHGKALLPPRTSSTTSRSRSLSISLAEERRSRSLSIGPQTASKRVLNREVSMSKSFKPGAKTLREQAKAEATLAAAKKREEDAKAAEVAKAAKLAAREGNTLIAESPAKPRVGIQSHDIITGAVTQYEEDWSTLSSPDPLLLRPGSDDDDDDDLVAAETPVKKKRNKTTG